MGPTSGGRPKPRVEKPTALLEQRVVKGSRTGLHDARRVRMSDCFRARLRRCRFASCRLQTLFTSAGVSVCDFAQGELRLENRAGPSGWVSSSIRFSLVGGFKVFRSPPETMLEGPSGMLLALQHRVVRRRRLARFHAHGMFVERMASRRKNKNAHLGVERPGIRFEKGARADGPHL